MPTNTELDRRLKKLERLYCCLSREVVFFDTVGDFPVEGVINTIYVDSSTGDIYIWDGAAYITAPDEDNYIESVADYDALRDLAGYVPSAIIVQDFSYVGPDGNNYTTKGGLFKKVSLGTENGGTIIVAADTTIWERQWDGINSCPEWWEVGGYDLFGETYTDKNILSANANTLLGVLGTLHDGIYNDRDRIQAAIYVNGEGVTNVIYEGREYLVDKVISNFNAIDSYDVQGTHDFNLATIKRIDSPVTTLAANLGAAATSITVVDASDFRVGQILSVFDTGAPLGGLGVDESGYLVITGIVGNVISVVNGTPAKTFVIGDIVMLEVTLYDNRVFTLGNVTYKNGYFDGNKLNNGAQRYIQDWRYNGSIFAGTNAGHVVFENIEFKDTPAENIMAGASSMNDCRGYNLDGSFFHYSMSDARYALNLQTGFIIDKCYIDGVCLATDAVSGHNEAAITNSLHTEFMKITNCTFKNGAEYVFAMDSGQLDTKCKFVISNNTFENFKQISFNRGVFGGIPEREDGLIISDNMFYNCGDLVLMDLFNAAGARQGKSINDLSITNNIFVGSRFIFGNTTNLDFIGNKVLFRDSLASPYLDYGEASIDSAPQFAALYLSGCSKVNISNNIFENQETEEQKLTVAIAVPVQDCTRMKNLAGVDTSFYYEQGISITDNKIYNFHTGINGMGRQGMSVTALANFYGVIGWEFSRNLIVLGINEPTTPGSASVKYVGISAPSGTVIDGNTIHQQRDDMSQAGIFARAYTPWPLTESGIIGAIIRNNYIYMRGTNIAITLNVFGSSGFYNENHVIVNNLHKGTIDGLNAARNYSLNNIEINTTNLPYMITPETHLFQGFEWNTGNY